MTSRCRLGLGVAVDRRPSLPKVVRIDPELLLPGIGDLADESVGLAMINGTYVEAFLLGANHELAREMIWREYPADLAGTWLRMFWDPAGADGTATFRRLRLAPERARRPSAGRRRTRPGRSSW